MEITKLQNGPGSGPDRERTLGEMRIRTEFNPPKSSEVDLIKQKTAELIDLVDNLRLPDQRLKAIAMTTYEEAAMWAVKAATA